MKQILILLFSILSVNSMAQNNQPTADWAGTNRYALENRNLKPPAKNENRVVFMGNSITESWKIIDSSFFANSSYINRGISSQTTVHMLARFQQDVIALQPKVVVILAGINDIAQNNGPIAIKDIFYNIVSMAQLAKANKIKVILCSVLPAFDFPWRRGLEPAEKIIRLNNLIEAYCKENKIVYVDYHSHMADKRKGLPKKYADDEVHPTLAGYKIMEPLVNEAIQVALKK